MVDNKQDLKVIEEELRAQYFKIISDRSNFTVVVDEPGIKV